MLDAWIEPGQSSLDGDDDEARVAQAGVVEDIRIVQKPNCPAKPPVTNKASSDDPITISGEAIGRKVNTLATDRPRNRCRTRAKAIKVPRMVAPRVAPSPIWTDSTTDSHIPNGSHGFSQLCRVKPSKE